MMKASWGWTTCASCCHDQQRAELEERWSCCTAPRGTAGNDLRSRLPPVGVMIEVPAVYQARELARRVDFLSVGSNDLAQYLLAVDAITPGWAPVPNLHPAVLRALYEVVTAATARASRYPSRRDGRRAGRCRAVAGMGFDMLSMSANRLAKVKAAIRPDRYARRLDCWRRCWLRQRARVQDCITKTCGEWCGIRFMPGFAGIA